MFGRLGIPSGGGGCAAHRPPHRRERKHNDGKCKSMAATASIQTFVNKAQGAAKGMSQDDPFQTKLARGYLGEGGRQRFPVEAFSVTLFDFLHQTLGFGHDFSMVCVFMLGCNTNICRHRCSLDMMLCWVAT